MSVPIFQTSIQESTITWELVRALLNLLFFLLISPGPGRCSVPSRHSVILQRTFFSWPPGTHQASRLQKVSATQGPSLKPQTLHLFPAPAAKPIIQGRRSLLMAVTSGQPSVLQPSSALEPVRGPGPLPAGISSTSIQWLVKGWRAWVGARTNGSSDWGERQAPVTLWSPGWKHLWGGSILFLS